MFVSLGASAIARAQENPPSAARASAASTVLANPASDDASRTACRQAYEGAQLRRREQDLLQSRAQLRVCGSETCPAFVRADCIRWLEEVEAAIPTLVLESFGDEGAVFDVSVRIDGAAVAAGLDGRPIAVNPGLHRVTFERRARPAQEQTIIVREGERSRLVEADWTARVAPTSAGRSVHWVPTGVYVNAGIAALGFIDFAVASLLGNDLKAGLEADRCAPFCPRGQTDALRARYLVADIGLVVGVSELASAALWWILDSPRPKRPPPLPRASGVLLFPSASKGASGRAFQGALFIRVVF